MFVKHSIKTLRVSVTIVWPSSGGCLSCLVLLLLSLLVCVVKLFIWYVAVCCLCVCVPDVLVCGMFGCEKKWYFHGLHKPSSTLDSGRITKIVALEFEKFDNSRKFYIHYC